VVDDATRIDASALNTLSGFAPASTIAAQSDVTGLNDPTAADIADAVWDEVIETAHETDGTAGEHLNALAKDILARTNNQTLNALLGVDDAAGEDVPGQTAEEVWAEGTRVLTANTNLNDPTAADIVDEWETQSQADPTGFHVNVLEIGGTAQTANDVGGDVNDILVDTNALNDTKIPDTLSLANINAQVDTALADINLDHLVDIAVDTDFATTVHEDSVLGQMAQRGGANLFDRSTDSLEAIINTAPLGTAMRGTDNAALASVCTEGRLSELDAGNLPSDIDDILADTGEIGAAGAGLTALPWNSAWDTEVESECTDALNTYDPPTKAELDSGLAGLNDITAADVWDATEAITTDAHSFETIMARIYMFLFHEMNITDSTGAVQVRNTGDSGNVLTHTITDDDTTTDRTKTSFV
jgi:hypothetical protein